MRGTAILSHLQHAGSSMILLVALLCLVACGGGSANSAANTRPATAFPNRTPTQPGNLTPAPTPTLGVKPCPAAVSSTAYWDAIIPTQANTSRVESITCFSLFGNTSLQALVNVRWTGMGRVLDAYIYNAISAPTPRQLFKLLSLYKGDARISPYSTLLTAEVDQSSAVNKNAGSPNELQQDLFREFKWSDGAGTLVQVAFPSIFPDLTRYQAEADQRQVDQGHQSWKRDARMTANTLAATLLKWSSNAPASIVSGGGPHDVDAVVTVKSTHPGTGSIQVTMSRLEGKVGSGIWMVTGVSANTLTITSPPPGDRLSSPATVQGTGQAFEGSIGTLTILDHTYSDIGHADVKGKDGMGSTIFSSAVSYSSTFKTGNQEGIVALYAHSNADGSISAASMVKVLL